MTLACKAVVVEISFLFLFYFILSSRDSPPETGDASSSDIQSEKICDVLIEAGV